MRIGIVGSRRRNDLRAFRQVLNLVDSIKSVNPSLTIVSGGCRKGADHFAEDAARVHAVPIVIHPVDTSEGIQGRWHYREKAYARNRDIAADCDELYAWVAEDRTGGTENTIKHALELGKKIYLVDGSGRVYLSKDGKFPSCEPLMHL